MTNVACVLIGVATGCSTQRFRTGRSPSDRVPGRLVHLGQIRAGRGRVDDRPRGSGDPDAIVHLDLVLREGLTFDLPRRLTLRVVILVCCRVWERMLETVVSATMPDASETPEERIERLVAGGWITAEAVERPRQVWAEQRLLDGITLPTGERVFVTEGDLHHILEDDRILRKPERIERALTHIMELRSAKQSRRMGLS